MKRFLFILFCGVLIFGIAGCNKSTKYSIDILKLDDISSITIDTLSQYDNIIEIDDETRINTIYDIFNNKITYNESVNDNPTNPDVLYLVEFNSIENNSTSAYVYKRNNKYYIEQPYNGIYNLSEKEFKVIENLTK